MVEDLGQQVQQESIARIVNKLHLMIKRLVPVRFGIISIMKESSGVSSTCLIKALIFGNHKMNLVRNYSVVFASLKNTNFLSR